MKRYWWRCNWSVDCANDVIIDRETVIETKPLIICYTMLQIQ